MRKLQIQDAEVMRIAIQQEIERSEESRNDQRQVAGAHHGSVVRRRISDFISVAAAPGRHPSGLCTAFLRLHAGMFERAFPTIGTDIDDGTPPGAIHGSGAAGRCGFIHRTGADFIISMAGRRPRIPHRAGAPTGNGDCSGRDGVANFAALPAIPVLDHIAGNLTRKSARRAAHRSFSVS